MKYRFLLCLLSLLLVAALSTPFSSAAVTKITCAMCGKPVHPQLTTRITIGKERQYFCCPHCAIMCLTAQPDKATKTKVTLTDYHTGAELSATEAIVIWDDQNVLCCAPTILAFKKPTAAASYGKGRILSWVEAFQETSQTCCGFCGMTVYAPEAYWVRTGNSGRDGEYACCIMCALGLSCLKATEIQIETCCRECGQKIQISSGVNGKNGKSKPETAVIWQGLKAQPDKIVPAGCHFNLLFCAANCVGQYRQKHPDLKHRELTLTEAFATVAQAAARKKAN